LKILILFNREPYDTTDVTWNGLRLAGKLLEAGQHAQSGRKTTGPSQSASGSVLNNINQDGQYS